MGMKNAKWVLNAVRQMKAAGFKAKPQGEVLIVRLPLVDGTIDYTVRTPESAANIVANFYEVKER